MEENPYNNEETNSIGNSIENVKKISDAIKGVNLGSEELNVENAESIGGTQFTVAKSSNLPEKTGFWTKLKNALFYEVKVELTPYQQKIEDEINDFLHQEVTWKSIKEAALAEAAGIEAAV